MKKCTVQRFRRGKKRKTIFLACDNTISVPEMFCIVLNKCKIAFALHPLIVATLNNNLLLIVCVDSDVIIYLFPIQNYPQSRCKPQQHGYKA